MSMLDFRAVLNLSSPDDEEKQEKEFRRRFYEDKKSRAKFLRDCGVKLPRKPDCVKCSDTGTLANGRLCNCWHDANYWYLKGLRESETTQKLKNLVQFLQAEGII